MASFKDSLLLALLSPAAAALTGAIFLATYLFYKWLLPKPIPGIPYNPNATKSIFGDVTPMLEHLKTSQEFQAWLVKQHQNLNSPIVQVFLNLFSKPVVMISDARESQDILMRRTKEFDKPDFISDIFLGMSPKFHARHTTGDAWRYQRKLVQDMVTPAFLNTIAAPQIHHSFMDLINLWLEKAQLGEGRPFTVKQDVYVTALEAAWAAIFGIENMATVTRNQTALLCSQGALSLPASIEEEIEVPRAPAPPVFRAVLGLTDGVEHIVKSPVPRLASLWQRYSPSGRRHLAIIKHALANEVAKAEERLRESEGKEERITNAVDHMLRKERAGAEKAGRPPEYQSPIIIDELLGLLVAAHDTTSTTLLWGIKYLTKHQGIQSKLRSTLRSTFTNARSEKRVPSAHEIATAQSHYLDAFIEELNRHSTTGMPSRNTTKDAVVLGHVIPKGTRVFFLTPGGGIIHPAYDIPDHLRSEQYLKAGGGKTGTWDPNGIELFNPDRWLVYDKEMDSVVYDAMAGPHIAFGGGLRGCFGKKMAYLEMRLAIVLMVWTFKFLEVPEKYGGWEAQDGLTHVTVQCYVKLAKA